MKTFKLLLLFTCIVLMLSACSGQPTETAQVSRTVTRSSVFSTVTKSSATVQTTADSMQRTEENASSTLAASDSVSLTPSPAGKKTIEIWVPPQLDPSKNPTLATVLREKIDEFTQENPNAVISIRVKAESGNSSAFNTLSAAKNAAPEVIPSLAILSRNDMITAAQRGLIYPISTGIFTEGSTWFNYARKASLVDNLIYGIPIAGDPIVLGYRPSMTGSEVTNWEEILSRGLPIGFYPARPDDPFGAFIYLSKGGNMIDDLGRPWLDQSLLTSTLELFLTGGQQGAFPPSLAMENNPDRNMQLFLEGTMHMIVTHLSNFRYNQRTDTAAIPLPIDPEIDRYPMVNSWNIVLTDSNPNIQNLAVKFAEKLAAPAFNDRWTQILGFLPVRTSDLESWEKDPFYDSMRFIAERAELIPVNNVLNAVLPSINSSITSVIRTSSLPEEAARSAVEALDK